jgi:hypothetical protein
MLDTVTHQEQKIIGKRNKEKKDSKTNAVEAGIKN